MLLAGAGGDAAAAAATSASTGAGGGVSGGDSGQPSGSDRVAASLAASIESSGLTQFRETLLDAGRTLRRLVDHNSSTFHHVYSKILSDAATALPEASAPMA